MTSKRYQVPARRKVPGTSLRSDPCIFCKDSQIQILFPAGVIEGNVAVLRCQKCGLVYLESRTGETGLDPEETAYWDNEDQKKVYLQEKIQETFAREFEARLASIERYYPGKGRILDVGCGVGHFLFAASKRGWQTLGLDIANAASRAAKEGYGLEVAVGTLESVSIPEKSLDVITLWDVIEHVRRPGENVAAINGLLKTGGLVVMKTPDESSLYKWVARAAYRLFGNRARFLVNYVYYVPHYFAYNRKTISRLLEQCGFEVIGFEMDRTPVEFAAEKINIHYKKDKWKKWVIALLPIADACARILGKGNKMTVYARKVKTMVPGTDVPGTVRRGLAS